MPKTQMLRFRATAQQAELIRQIAQQKGYLKLSPYLLDSALKRVLVDELHNKIVRELEWIKQKINQSG